MTVSSAAKYHTDVRNPHIRAIDLRRDLFEVADLIELCFGASMDEDGVEYLRQLRKSAQDARMLEWATSMTQENALPVSGFVWWEDQEIIGNLTLIPMTRNRRRVFLIANVAVKPDFRRQGIARELTNAALEYVRNRGAWSACLQVREDNEAAKKLYTNLGFIEKAVRTTWRIQSGIMHGTANEPGKVSGLKRAEWETIKPMFKWVYPPDVSWNLNLHLDDMQPTIINTMSRWLSGDSQKIWVLREKGTLLGGAAWNASRSWADNIWIAANASTEDQIIRSLLPYAVQNIRRSKPQAVNYPAGRAVDSFLAAGFTQHLQLVWMEVPMKNEDPSSKVLGKAHFNIRT